MSSWLLEVDGLRKSFSGIAAVDGCSLQLEANAITGLIGPNGAGKSTAFNLISGLIRPDTGRIVLDGRDVAGLAAHRIARLGLARTFQIPRTLGDMTVLETLMLVPTAQSGERLASLLGTGRAVRREEAVNRRRAMEVLAFVELAEQAHRPSVSLSGGQKKLLELARCLMASPRLMLLDEPMAGVNPRLIGDVVKVLKRIHADGVTLLIIEHNMNVVMELCDTVIVMNQGRTLASGTPDEIQTNDRVLRAYLGGADA